jgi:hypothetical protein
MHQRGDEGPVAVGRAEDVAAAVEIEDRGVVAQHERGDAPGGEWPDCDIGGHVELRTEVLEGLTQRVDGSRRGRHRRHRGPEAHDPGGHLSADGLRGRNGVVEGGQDLPGALEQGFAGEGELDLMG